MADYRNFSETIDTADCWTISETIDIVATEIIQEQDTVITEILQKQ